MIIKRFFFRCTINIQRYVWNQKKTEEKNEKKTNKNIS